MWRAVLPALGLGDWACIQGGGFAPAHIAGGARPPAANAQVAATLQPRSHSIRDGDAQLGGADWSLAVLPPPLVQCLVVVADEHSHLLIREAGFLLNVGEH